MLFFFNYYFKNFLFFYNVVTVRSLSFVAFKDVYNFFCFYFLVLFFDFLLLDDDPFFEPIEWSYIQTIILFVMIFSWIIENIVSSRFGLFLGKDKRLWLGWYKTFVLTLFWYFFNIIVVIVLIITPFYFELNFNVYLINGWYLWFTKIFFLKLNFFFFTIFYLLFLFKLSLSFLTINNFTFLLLVIFNVYVILYFFFLNVLFFTYFNDYDSYNLLKKKDLYGLSSTPFKWSWGEKGRDHFSSHNTTISNWFKYDKPLGNSFFFLNFFFILFYFFIFFFFFLFIFKNIFFVFYDFSFYVYCFNIFKVFWFFLNTINILNIFFFFIYFFRGPYEFLWYL